MDLRNILEDKKEDIYIIKINNPNSLNALTEEVLDELNVAIDYAQMDESIKVIIITGEGKAFVAGADISSMKDMIPYEAREFSKKGSDLFRKIESLSKIVICAVNGFALGGGCELAMCCDIRIGSNKAKFGLPEVGLGIIPGFSGTQRLSRLVGTAKAKELICTGDIIDCNEAYRLNLLNKVVDEENLINEALAMAKKIKSKSKNAISYAKYAVNVGIQTDIDTGIAYERELFALCFSNEDQREGMNAFLEKRKPNFK